jgi:phospholipid/cholesterol/gamma-HCH transport system permease protein
VGQFTHFAGKALTAAFVALARPRELGQQLYPIYVGALPLASVTGLGLGVVIWMHLHGVLIRAGPGYTHLLPQFLALAVVLEFAPLCAGLIVAGRSGASLAAELGSMRLTEQVDALALLGLSPVRFLAGPRVLACMVALPLLTVMIATLSIAGSFVAEALGGAMSWREYWNACRSNLLLRDIVPATLKTAVFGYLIGVTGCWFGLTADGGTEGVGKAATRGVAGSILSVIVANVILVRMIQLLG